MVKCNASLSDEAAEPSLAMADYYSILAKAVNALDPNTGTARQRLYQRARCDNFRTGKRLPALSQVGNWHRRDSSGERDREGRGGGGSPQLDLDRQQRPRASNPGSRRK